MTESEMNSTSLSWAALIGYWLDFARAAVCLPENDEGAAWSSSVTPAITLQAVIFALEHLDDLDLEERSLGLDRAELLVQDAETALHAAWNPMGGLPDGLVVVLTEAKRALRRGETGPALEIIAGGSSDPSDPWIMPDWRGAVAALQDVGAKAAVWLASPGTALRPGEPVGFIEARDPMRLPRMEDSVEGAAWRGLYQSLTPVQMRRVAYPRQVYRQIEDGRIIGDVALALSDDPIAGQPLLAPVLRDGARIPLPGQVEPGERELIQRAAWPAGGPSFEDGTLGVSE